MSIVMTSLPTLPVLLPILGAALSVVLGTSVTAQRVIALVTLGAVAAYTMPTAVRNSSDDSRLTVT